MGGAFGRGDVVLLDTGRLQFVQPVLISQVVRRYSVACWRWLGSALGLTCTLPHLRTEVASNSVYSIHTGSLLA